MKRLVPIFAGMALILTAQQECQSGTDLDEDGWTTQDGDCDDDNAEIHPGASEACDGVDNDCDGEIDEGIVGDSSECAGSSCAAILTERTDAADGIYWLDPQSSGTAMQVYCDMTLDGGGWNLLSVTSDDGQDTWTWNNHHFEQDNGAFGDVLFLNRDFKSEIYHLIPFTDLLFVHSTPSDPTNPIWAAYEDANDGTTDIGTFIASFPESSYYSNTDGFAMSAGTLSETADMCSTNLAINACGTDGGSSCTNDDNGYGPNFNTYWNNGCPYDDAGYDGGLGPHNNSTDTEYLSLGFGRALGLNTGESAAGANYIQMYVR